MIQAAHFDIKTVTGLRQALVLSAEYENEPFPLEGYTLHGSIGTYPRMDLKCSVDENGRARIEWDSVPPGNWKYDVFLISASNDETPLMEGTFTALPRITPVLDDESVNDEVGGVLHLPSGNEGTITLEVDGGFVSKEYAAIAKDAADKAQQALEDIKQALQGVVTSIGGASGDILLDSGLKITGDQEKGTVSLSLDDKTVVLTAGDQTIDGVKTFSSPPVIASAPASNNEAANKKYVDDMAGKATGTTINGVSGNITLNLPMELDPDTKSMSIDLSGYASLQVDNVFEGGNTFMAGIKGHVDSVTSTAILYATNVPRDSSSGHQVLSIEHIGSSNVRISSGTHLMLKARGGNIYAESSFTANGGINIPLAVGAATDTSAVNRLYAAGLAAVTDAFSVRCYPLLAGCSSSNGTVFKTDREPNSLYFNVPPNSAFTVKCGLVTNARPMHNYSSIRGWVAPLRLPAVSTKFTARFGQMTTVARMGRDRDAFTLVPDQAAGGYRIGEIIDITFDHVRDADAGGYHIRVREIYYSNAEQKWKMKTTQALAPETSSNNGYPVCVYAVVYEQYQDGGYDTEDRGALWLLHGGNSSRGCVKIATVKGVHCFESIYPFSGYYLDIENTNSWALAGAFLPATMHLHCNNVNPAYYGFSSMESNIIVSEAVEDFVDPEAETITED